MVSEFLKEERIVTKVQYTLYLGKANRHNRVRKSEFTQVKKRLFRNGLGT